jgi:hypothetical protein
VRGRGLAIYLTAFNGALAGGGACWGLLAEVSSLPTALLLSAAGMTLTAAALNRLRLPSDERDLTPAGQWPGVAEQPQGDLGPVLVLVHYNIARKDRDAWLHIVTRLAGERRRDGAHAWGVTEDASDPSHLVEWFLTESWNEHLRHHLRVSVADADVQHEAGRFNIGGAPRVEHYRGISGRSHEK